jgi:HPt (histidine-containing phosphotransfer) domain-containing protein
MSTDNNNDMKDIMKELQDEYIRTLPEKIKSLEAHFQKLEYDKVTDAFHKIKGSGMTYGVPELSAIGATLETICQKHPQQMGWAVAKSYYLMQQVYTYRLSGRAYAPEKNEDFKRMLAIVEGREYKSAA